MKPSGRSGKPISSSSSAYDLISSVIRTRLEAERHSKQSPPSFDSAVSEPLPRRKLQQYMYRVSSLGRAEHLAFFCRRAVHTVWMYGVSCFLLLFSFESLNHIVPSLQSATYPKQGTSTYAPPPTHTVARSRAVKTCWSHAMPIPFHSTSPVSGSPIHAECSPCNLLHALWYKVNSQLASDGRIRWYTRRLSHSP